MRDFSGFANTITLFRAEPRLIDGTPFDYGIHQGGVKSICQRFNRPDTDTENLEHIRVTDVAGLQVTGISTGISFFIRFRIHDLALQGTTTPIERTLFEKVDDATPSNAYQLQVDPDGRLIFYLKIGGVVYSAQTATTTIAINTVYEVWVTYANSGNVIHIYVNNADKSLTTPATAPTWQADTSVPDLFIFRRGYESPGYVYGDLYDFELFKEKVVSSTEVGYHYTNKWTIANIPFSQVLIGAYWAAYGEVGNESFTSTSFTSTSFTVPP